MAATDPDAVFLRACRREPVPYTPVWLMRQAGRYQPEYRALRSRVSFVELCKRPDLAAEVTLLPVSQLGVDAAILFADILLVLEPLGIGFEFNRDEGPHIARPIRERGDLARVSEDIGAAESLAYVMEAARLTRAGLPASVPLIGFAGAPFTLASYAIEGGSSRNYVHTKRLMFSDEGAWNELMTRLSRAIADYLRAQIDAGCDAVQLFDSWVGTLAPADYERYVLPHVRSIFAALPSEVPAIHFGTGNPALYPLMKRAGGSVIGVDWRVDLGAQWDALGPDVGIQGNLDPAALLAPREVLLDRVDAVLASARGRPGHVFNLGHGIFPEVHVDQVRAMVDRVHERSARGVG
jgi:uroporphyrinogen decarboxylase